MTIDGMYLLSSDWSVPFINALDYATGDGTTDDTAGLQSAIEAADGKILYVPKGTYLLNQNASTGYCLRIMNPVRIVMEPEAVLLLAASVANTVRMVQIGDGTDAITDVTIEGGTLNGNAVANGGVYGVGGGQVAAVGPVQRIGLRSVNLINSLGVALLVSGTLSTSRAKHITVEDCTINWVGEGVRFEKCDQFHMRGGSITESKNQDLFEPHGAVTNWSLRDCYLDAPDPTNSAIEVYPQHGDIVNGLIENCTIVNDELRVSLSSGTGGNVVENLTVRNCYFKNSNVYAGVNGQIRDLTIEGCRFEGPCNVPRNASKPFNGILVHGGNNNSKILNNTICNYQSNGILTHCARDLIFGNKIYNNGQDASIPESLRRGVYGQGIAIANEVFDDQETKTQLYGIDASKAIGNVTYGHALGNLSVGVVTRFGNTDNTGKSGDKIIARVTIPAGDSFKNIDQAATGLTVHDSDKIIIQPLGSGNQSVDPMAPATAAWMWRGGSTLRLQLNASLTNACSFLLIRDKTVPETTG